MRNKDWEFTVFEEKNADDLNYTKDAPMIYNGRVACKIDDKYVFSSYNREDGKLFFEVSEIK